MTIIRCLDFETTGFPPKAGVCEVGWTDIIINDAGDGMSATTALLCNPGMPIERGAQDVHGISDAMVAGMPPTSERFSSLMDGADVFCAHNAEFEQQFFGGGERPWICTYKVAFARYPDIPNHRNGTIPGHLGIELDPERSVPLHRAGPDTYVTAMILRRALADGCTVAEMIEITKRPRSVKRMPFGKYQGKLLSELPRDYLQWAVDKMQAADVRQACRDELARRRAQS